MNQFIHKIRAKRRRTVVLEGPRAYAAWAPQYPPVAHNPLMRAEQQAVEAILDTIAADSALDVGTGTGRYLPVLARRGVRRLVGLDRSWSMLTRARGGAPLVLADARSLPFAAARFDLVLASLVAGDVADLEAWTAELGRVLRPGGHLLYSDFHPTWTAAGWRRTFALPEGTRVIVPLAAHPWEAHQRAIERAGLILVERRDVSLSREPDAQAAAFRARWGDAPVALVVHACKTTAVHPTAP